MAQGFRDFSSETLDAQPSGLTLSGIGAGSVFVRSVTGATGGRALSIRPESGNRYSTVFLDAIEALSASNFELQIRFRLPTGTTGFNQGAGLFARVDPTGHPGYAVQIGDQGFFTPSASNSITRTSGLLNMAGLTQLANNSLLIPAADTWYRMIFRVNGTSIRAWYGTDAGWTKTNASTPDLEATDATYSSGVEAGILWDASSGTHFMDVDWIGYGTDGDAAPTSPPSTGSLIRRDRRMGGGFGPLLTGGMSA